jgi:AcrR family transcriptional regulator
MSKDSHLSTPESEGGGHRSRRRQARGERRIDQALDAAALVFAEAGYEAATTNAIAARAGMSPGSLYQFFENKEAVAEALAARYEAELGLARQAAFTPEMATLSLDTLLDTVVDPLVRFNIANPGFQALFADPGVPERLASSTRRLHAAVQAQVEAMVAARAPELPDERRARCATVSVQLFRAMLPLILAASGQEREAVVADLKSVLRGYLGPIIG